MLKKPAIIIAFLLLGGATLTMAQPEEQGKVKWYTIQEVEQLSKNEPRKVMIDVYTDWCGWCKKMDANTFDHPVIAEYINKNFYPVKLNAETKDEITFMGKTFKYVQNGRNGYNELAAGLLNGQMSFPSIAYLNEKLELLGAIPGYRPPKEMESILNYINEDKFEDQTLSDYEKTFTSKIN